MLYSFEFRDDFHQLVFTGDIPAYLDVKTRVTMFKNKFIEIICDIVSSLLSNKSYKLVDVREYKDKNSLKEHLMTGLDNPTEEEEEEITNISTTMFPLLTVGIRTITNVKKDHVVANAESEKYICQMLMSTFEMEDDVFP